MSLAIKAANVIMNNFLVNISVEKNKENTHKHIKIAYILIKMRECEKNLKIP